VVLVFEDLHWADPPLLEFIEYLVEWSTGVPILIMGTGRPEMFEKYPNWAGGSRNAATISLSPLTDSEIAQLVSGLLPQTVLPAQTHAALLEQAGGNPLYAEEFIRMLSDRGVLTQKGRTLALDPAADIPMPDKVQALIAARLDTLPPERKLLLQNAAVVGCGRVRETNEDRRSAPDTDDRLFAMFPVEAGVTGALVRGNGHRPSTEGALVFLNADDELQPVVERVEEAGGRVISPLFDMGEWGVAAFIIDSEGNKAALHARGWGLGGLLGVGLRTVEVSPHRVRDRMDWRWYRHNGLAAADDRVR
jgi:predicted enzyme related to lactoylglutathione lyase